MPINSIKIVGDQTKTIEGEAPAGTATLEAIDLSYAAANRMAIDAYAPLGSVQANGKFAIDRKALQNAKEGDYVRMRALGADGSVKGIVTLRLHSAGAVDATNAPFVGRRLALYDDGTGKNAIVDANDYTRPISEPFAKLKVSNPRTGESKVVELDADGLFPQDFSIGAIAGDRLKFAISDGTSNTSFATTDTDTWTVVGKVAHPNDLADPAPLAEASDKKGRSKIGLVQFTAPVIQDGVSAADVNQRFIGDCFLSAAFASIAHTRPDMIMNMIKPRPDGNYEVIFKVWSNVAAKYVDKKVPVDTDFYVDSSGKPVYGAGLPNTSSVPNAQMETWFPLVEKAWARHKKSYVPLGAGGWPSEIFTAVFGKQAISLDVSDADSLWTRITKSVDQKKPSALCTDSDEERYEGTNIHGNHCYSILEYRTDAQGRREVQLRNPWGYSEPGNDGKDDGTFWMPIEQAAGLFTGFFSLR